MPTTRRPSSKPPPRLIVDERVHLFQAEGTQDHSCNVCDRVAFTLPCTFCQRYNCAACMDYCCICANLYCRFCSQISYAIRS